MWMRFDATTRSPASSSILVTAPVRLRRVASGLMIEKVRVAAMTGRSPAIWLVGICGPTSRAVLPRQGLRLLDPLAVLLGPAAPGHTVPAGKKLPCKARGLERGVVEQIEAAVVGQRGFAPVAIGDQHVARLVRRIGARRKKNWLTDI